MFRVLQGGIMVKVCFYFQVHQPFRMQKYTVFDIGNKKNYFDESYNKEVMQRVAKKCYLPANTILLNLLKTTPLKLAFSITGTALEQFEKYAPEVLESFKELVKTGKVELLSETSHHSLSFLFSKEEFVSQVEEHQRLMKKHFGVTPKVFRNTELIYNNELASFIEAMGFKGMLAEGAEKVLDWKSPNFVYLPKNQNIKVLLKNYKLSDDIAFRFSEKSWKEWPLTTEKFVKWVNSINGNGTHVNLFMDYETLGEHQWEDTGIFQFLEQLPHELLKHPDNSFATPSELCQEEAVGEIDVPDVVSWADIERDVSAWLGNTMQDSAISRLYALEKVVKKDKKLLETWRKLTTSDHFYYMCTKWFNDGDVHKYFNPYDSPYDAYMNFMNILKDMERRLTKKTQQNI